MVEETEQAYLLGVLLTKFYVNPSLLVILNVEPQECSAAALSQFLIFLIKTWPEIVAYWLAHQNQIHEVYKINCSVTLHKLLVSRP